MSLWRTTFAVAAVGTLAACNPYQNFSGEFYAGPVDPTDFAAAYVGTLPPGGTADQSGGTVAPNSAYVAGAPTFYYYFPLADSQVTPIDDTTPVTPLTLGSPFLNPPPAYVFDPTSSSAFPNPSKCVAPKNYIFDQRTEAYRRDEQGVIFTDIPSDPSYVPVIEEQVVTSNGEKCQSILSEKAVTSKRTDITVAAKPDGKFLAFAIVDPAADVQPNDATGLGPIHLGFYNHYLVSIIDGGYIPTVDVPAMGMTDAHTDLGTQIMYVPNSIPVDMDDGMGGTVTVAGMGGMGTGFDLLEAARGDANYSPLCEVWAYDPDVDPQTMLPVPATDVSMLTTTEIASAVDTGTAVYCLQVF